MTQVTVRNVEEAWVARAKAEAGRRGVSMNAILVEALAKGLGVSVGKGTNGLEKFAGDSPDEFGPEWDAAMMECERVDPEAWS
jgi:hypothetical protein